MTFSDLSKFIWERNEIPVARYCKSLMIPATLERRAIAFNA